MFFNFQGHKVILKPLSHKEVLEDQMKMKTKRENEKRDESKTSLNISSHAIKTIMLTHTKLIEPLRYTSFFSFSLPNNSKYLTSSTKKFQDKIQTPLKGSHLLRGSSKSHFIPKYFFPAWLVSRTYPYELPNLNEHNFTSHSTPHNILYMNKITMLFSGVINLRSNSLQLGGHDITKIAKKMTKDTRDTSHFDKSSQHPTQDPTKFWKDLSRRRIGHKPEHQSIKCSFFWSSYKTKCS